MTTPLFASHRDLKPNILAASAKPAAKPPENHVFRRGREAASLILVASAVFVALALGSFQGDPNVPEMIGPDWVGPVGNSISHVLVGSIGVLAWTVPLELILMAVPLFKDRPSIASIARIAGDLIVIFILTALVHVSIPDQVAFGMMPVGGTIGELFGELLRSLFSTVGSYIIGLTAVGLILIARASFSFISFARRAGQGTEVAAGKAASGVKALHNAWLTARDIEKKRALGIDALPGAESSAEKPDAVLASIDTEVEQASLEAANKLSEEARKDVKLSREDVTPEPLAQLQMPMLVATDDSPDQAPKPEKKRSRTKQSDPPVAVEQAPIITISAAMQKTDVPAASPAPVPAMSSSPAETAVFDSFLAEVATTPETPDVAFSCGNAETVEPAATAEPVAKKPRAPRTPKAKPANIGIDRDKTTPPPQGRSDEYDQEIKVEEPTKHGSVEPRLSASEPEIERDAVDEESVDEFTGDEEPLGVEPTPEPPKAAVSERRAPKAVVQGREQAERVEMEEAEPSSPAAQAAPKAPQALRQAPVSKPQPIARQPVSAVREPAKPQTQPAFALAEEQDEEEFVDEIPEPTPTPEPAPAPRAKPAPRPEPSVTVKPKIVDTTEASSIEKIVQIDLSPKTEFELPAFDLLEEPKAERLVIDEEQLAENAKQLVTTLNHFNVNGQVREIQPGPTVTTYELEPTPGTKVSTISSLSNDLAMNLGCSVRIVAPIPGKKRVGFELPNKKRIPVSLRELIEDKRFQELKTPLPVVLGRDIVGAPYYADLSAMPHVLVAGATGAGKSVGLNVMLVSLLYRRTPDEMRFLMIDPKVVELQAFDRMPHMLLPVVTDMKQAANALKWAVDEMERRYQLLANAGTKNITTYNAWVERVQRGEVPGFMMPKTSVTTGPDGSIIEVGPAKEAPVMPTKLSYIVVVVDEFADLMMQQGKEVEGCIARLAQKARAAGMHVILATQRPSADVITGMIKANFPTRIAFKVTQRVDSRIILDEQGAEHLLGKGDMLVKMNGSNETRRVQCPFVSEEEVEAVTGFLRTQGEPTYDESILQARDEGTEAESESQGEEDAKYDEAVQVVAMTRRCSTSWLQRKLGIGYNRAAKIVEIMEKRGLVGPANGARDREVLIEPL